MPLEDRGRPEKYGLAVGASALAFGLTWFVPPIATRTPAALFYAAVLVSAWTGGVGAALVALALSIPAIGYFLVVATGGYDAASHGLLLGVFVAVASAMIWLSDARKHAVESARRERERLLVTLRSIGDGVIATDASGRVTFLNAVAEGLTGWTSAEATGRPLDEVFRIVEERTREPVASPVSRVLRDGTVVGLANHTLLIARDGTERPVADSAAPIREGNRLSGVVLVIRDVTSAQIAERQREQHLLLEHDLRTRLERALATVLESEELFRTMADSAPVLLWMSDPDGLVSYVNRPWLEFTGRSLEQEVGNGWLDGVHPEDRERVLTVYRDAFDLRAPFDVEYRLRRADGAFRWVTDAGVPRYGSDGAFAGYIGSCVDISERRAADEERLRALERTQESARRLHSLQEIMEAALSTLSLDALVVELHRRIRRVLNVDTAAILLREGDVLVASAAKGIEEEVEQGVRIPLGAGFAGRVAAERRTIIIDELDRADVVNPILGQKGIRSLLGAPLVAEGEVIGVLHVGTLTPAHFTEDDAILLQLIADRVAVAIVHSRLYETERALRAEAEAASRAKDEFLATVSHELRTPLNAMLGWTRLLRTGSLDRSAEKRGLEVIERNVHTQSQLIEDLLDMARVVTGKLRLDVRPVALDDVVEAAVDSIRPAASAKQIEIDVRVEEVEVVVAGDSDRLQQIVWNLLTNAVKFTPKHGRVSVVVERVASHVEIRVADTGIGIDEEFLPHVFERFRQADSSTTREHGGLGLGLAIVRHLVELHGGSVGASSDGKGHGATFTVRLPVVAVHAPEPEPAPADEAVASDEPSGDRVLTGVKVLALDDESDARELLRFVLTRCGAEVVTVSSVVEAVTVLDAWRPDVLVSDIGMRDEDGYALIRQLRGRTPEAGGDVPAIALTAYARPEDRARLLDAGFQAHISKPADPDELVAVVAKVVARKQRPE